MPQTLLALLGLTLAASFALTQRELTTSAQMGMMRNEIGVVATGVAGQAFDQISAMPFDGNADATSPSAFTPPSAFGSAGSWNGSADIDDFHGKTHVFEVETLNGTLEIEVSAEVTYVRKVGAAFEPVSTPGYLKQVTLTLRGPLGFEGQLSRVYSYFDTGFGS